MTIVQMQTRKYTDDRLAFCRPLNQKEGWLGGERWDMCCVPASNGENCGNLLSNGSPNAPCVLVTVFDSQSKFLSMDIPQELVHSPGAAVCQAPRLHFFQTSTVWQQ